MSESNPILASRLVFVSMLLVIECPAEPPDRSDLALARSLMSPGFDLAGERRRLVEGDPYVSDWRHEVVRTNLVVRDLDGDGLKDVFMVVEANPHRRDSQGKECAISDTSCPIEWGDREIQVHFRNRDGSFRKLPMHGGMMMGIDEGGMDPDPFKGLVAKPDGTIEIRFHGGAGWVWDRRFDVRHLRDDLYIVRVSHSLANMDSTWTQEADLVRRQWKTASTAIGEDPSPPRVQNGRIPKGPLPRFSLANVEMDPCGRWPSTPVDSTWESPKGFSCH